jgi:hypothetical protein
MAAGLPLSEAQGPAKAPGLRSYNLGMWSPVRDADHHKHAAPEIIPPKAPRQAQS